MSLGADACLAQEMSASLWFLEQDREYQYRRDLLQRGVWETSAGQIRIADMTVSHIRNTINMLRRYAEDPTSDAQEMFAKFAIPVFESALNRLEETNMNESQFEFYDTARMTEFDSTVEQFKAQLRECVKDEWVSEMARLREENAKYADIKARWAEIELERQRERDEVERVKSNAENHARYARMEELFADVCSEVYTVNAVVKAKPKCGRCDDSRRIHYRNPITGKDMSETCPYCGENLLVSEPEMLAAYEVQLRNEYSGFNSLTAWYKNPKSNDGYLHVVTDWDDDRPFENIQRHDAYFKSRERCQEYCDWLNERDERSRNGAGADNGT